MLKFYSFLSFIFLLFTNNTINAQKINVYHQILASTDIVEISQYLKKLQPDDPQQKAVINRLKQLKNGNWKSEPRLQISALPKSEIPVATAPKPLEDEKEEFHNLMKESSEIHDKKALKVLNNIFNDNKEELESVLLVRNDSSCDIILRLQGKEQYNLAVPSKGENFINLNKDSYLIRGKVCNSEYSKTKDLTSNQILTLKYSEQN